jgi:hypothetical protein
MNIKEIIIEEVWDKIIKATYKNILKVKNKTSKRLIFSIKREKCKDRHKDKKECKNKLVIIENNYNNKPINMKMITKIQMKQSTKTIKEG